MQIQISFCSEEQYEEDERGFTYSDNIPKQAFFSLLSLFKSVIEGDPHYHVKLQNEHDEPFYLIFDLQNATAEK